MTASSTEERETTSDVVSPTLDPVQSAESAEPAPDKRRWAAFVIMTVATFMDMLDGSIVNVAIPSIQRDLGATYTSMQWVSAGYVLAFALLLITGGRLGDIYGRRRIFQVGVAGFAIASLLCGLATTPELLITARLIQGAAAGLMIPQVLSIIHVTFPNNEKGKVFAVHGTVGGLAATLAPLIGGVLVGLNILGLDWRPIFLVNVPIGVVGFILGMKYIPESKAPTALRLDIIGVVIATASLLLVLVPLTLGRELGWPVWSVVALVLAVVAIAGFVAWERHKQAKDGSPLVALSLFKSRSFSSALGLMLVCFAFTGMFMLALYMFMQLGLGWSPLRSGVTMLAFAIGAFITASASVIGLVPKFGRTVLQAGAVVIAVGLAVFLLTNHAIGWELTSWKLVPALFLIGLGFGCLATPISLFGLAEVPFKDAGSASGLINTMLQLGFTVGITAASLAFFAPLTGAASSAVDEVTPQLRQELVVAGVPADRLDSVTESYKSCVIQHYTGGSPTADPASCAVDPAVQGNPQAEQAVAKYTEQARAQTFSGAFEVTLFTGLGFVILAFFFARALPRRLAAPPTP